MLVNLDNVRKSIGRPVTESQKDEIVKDLEDALKDFTIREKESSAAAHTLPLVTVNKPNKHRGDPQSPPSRP